MPHHSAASISPLTAANHNLYSGGPPPGDRASGPSSLFSHAAESAAPPTQNDAVDSAPLWATEQVHRFWRQAASCLASMALHALIVILLGLWLSAPPGNGQTMSLVASMVDGTHNAETLETEEFQADSSSKEPASELAMSSLEQTSNELTEKIAADAQSPQAVSPSRVAESRRPQVASDLERALSDGSLADGDEYDGSDGDVTGALAGRGGAARTRLALAGGGSKESEDAVARGLRWLQAHQLADGGWCFDFRQGPCEGRCRDSGSEVSRTGATALALLAFLGRGETHLEGDYQDNVKRGLYFLTGRMLASRQGGDLRGGGNMYSHGIAAIALCEAYAMTHDKDLEPFAQQAIDFIVNAQDKRGGGWRYVPGIPGDTTVTGWQIMALKSGQMGYLRVPYETIQHAGHFLDSVQLESGARYGYVPALKERRELTTTSVGLLCRMYTGWPKNHPALQKGVRHLAKEGPSMLGRNANMYYNYYATQIMHQFGGDPWELWNSQMRDFLVRTQVGEGHESGSWYFDGGQAKPGGRLYVTAVAIMTLEVYYRHMPLYAEHAVGY
jgi:hypothetical protein